MAYYMYQASFTADAWAKMVKEPQDREKALRPVIEKLGGKLIGYWMAFGESDAVVIVQLPDNVSAAAASLAATAGGAVKSLKTTALMSIDESMQAMKKASAPRKQQASIRFGEQKLSESGDGRRREFTQRARGGLQR